MIIVLAMDEGIDKNGVGRGRGEKNENNNLLSSFVHLIILLQA